MQREKRMRTSRYSGDDIPHRDEGYNDIGEHQLWKRRLPIKRQNSGEGAGDGGGRIEEAANTNDVAIERDPKRA